jgi:rare lipoprotein A (peptidoglycan hydrolase)
MTLNKRIVFLSLLFSFSQCYGFAQKKFTQSGVATYYADYFQGRRTSSGELYNKAFYTAAHPTLPFQTLVKITNLKNNLYVIVKINDRCPKYYNRIIDLSRAAASKIDMILAGRVNVSLEEITPADLNIINREPEKPDTNFKLIIPDSLSQKYLNSGQLCLKNDIEKKLLINHYSFLLPEAFMLKPEEVGSWVYRKH